MNPLAVRSSTICQSFSESLTTTRLVHYEGVFHDRSYDGSTDIESRMYPPVTEIREFLKEFPDKPFILCEYTHAMGNSNGAMHKYIEYNRGRAKGTGRLHLGLYRTSLYIKKTDTVQNSRPTAETLATGQMTAISVAMALL